jgi:hypothetical protein
MLGVPGPRHVRLAKQFSEDITVQQTVLPCDILLFDKVVDEDVKMLLGLATLTGGFMSCSLNSTLILVA